MKGLIRTCIQARTNEPGGKFWTGFRPETIPQSLFHLDGGSRRPQTGAVARKSVLTLSQAETARRRAVTGLHNLGDDDAAEEFERMTPQQYAEHKGIEVIKENPRSYRMARKTQSEIIADLKDRLSDLEDTVEELGEQNETLQARLDAAADAIAGEPDEEDSEDSDLDDESDTVDADEDEDDDEDDEDEG